MHIELPILIKLLKNIFFKFGGEGTSRVITFVFYIYVARCLGDSGFGEYAFAMSFASIFLVLSDLGFNTLLIRDVASDKSKLKQYIGNITSLKIILSVIVFIIMSLIISISSYSYITVLSVQLAGLLSIFSTFIEYVNAIFNSFDKMHNEMWIKMINKLIIVALGTVCLIVRPESMYLIGTIAGANIITVLISLLFLMKYNIKLQVLFEKEFLKEFFKQAIPMAIASVCVVIYFRIDIVMLSYMNRTDAEIGWYSIAVRLIDALAVTPYLIMSAMFPILSRLSNSAEGEKIKEDAMFSLIVKKAFKYMTVISVVLTVAVFFSAKEIILLLYGERFINSVPALKCIIFMLPFMFINFIFVYVLTIKKKQNIMAVYSFLCIFINIGVNLLLIPSYGYIGAAISTVLTEMVLALLYINYIYKNKIY